MIRVLLVSRETLFTRLLKHVLERQDDILVLPEITELDEIQEHAAIADLVLISHEYERVDALHAISRLQEAAPLARVVMLRVPNMPDEILSYLEAGARGYLRADDEIDQLLVVIRTVAEQGAFVDPSIAPLLCERLSEMSRALSDPAGDLDFDAEVTQRELEILALIHAGHTNQEIAEQLDIGVGTVKNHVHNILSKLQARDREDAARWYAWKQGVSFAGPEDQGAGREPLPLPVIQRVNAIYRWSSEERAGLRAMLDGYCARLGWPVGHLLVLDGAGGLAPSGIWSTDGALGFEQFRAATEGRRVSLDGVVGRQVENPRPLWIIDVRRDSSYGRRDVADLDGLRSGLYLPVLDGERVVGVLEFYSTEQAHPSPAAVAEIMRASTELAGQVAPEAEGLTDDAELVERL